MFNLAEKYVVVLPNQFHVIEEKEPSRIPKNNWFQVLKQRKKMKQIALISKKNFPCHQVFINTVKDSKPCFKDTAAKVVFTFITLIQISMQKRFQLVR